MSEKTEVVTGYKGFDSKLKCKEHQYEVEKEYTYDDKIDLCQSGYHFCEYPLDVFTYYNPANSRFAEVEADEVLAKRDGDTKRVCKTIRIKAELTLKDMIDAAIKFTFDRAIWSEKENHTEEYRGAASASGYRGAASATGKEGHACALGVDGKAQAAIGGWITLAEWKEFKEEGWRRIDVQTVKVDGETIKANTWYMLQNGKFVEVVP